MMKNLHIASILIVLLARFAAANDQYNLDKGLAIQGYDPVAYFDNASKKGSEQIMHQHEGVTYRFASEANRDRFKTDPTKYKPAYGGWCATAMADGRKVEIDPTNFKITNGRLFLFYKSFWADARKDWIKDEPGLTVKADAAWKKIAGE